mgnify:CR=1 FL=1
MPALYARGGRRFGNGTYGRDGLTFALACPKYQKMTSNDAVRLYRHELLNEEQTLCGIRANEEPDALIACECGHENCGKKPTPRPKQP